MMYPRDQKLYKNMQNDNIWEKALLSLDATVEDGIKSLEESGLQICLVVDKNKKLLGSVTDGDIRRSLLAQKSLQNKIDTIMTKKPLVIHQGLESDQIKLLMNANKINQLPEIDKKGAVIGLHTWENIIKPVKRPNTFVIMAGGFGTRMEEITESCPKPMVKLGGKPMLEHIIDRAKIEGFTNFIISVFYLKDQIKEYFGDGKKWDVHINYIEESEPLGTAGALSLIEINLQYPFIVTNGDVITDIKYGDLIEYHNTHSSEATMAVRKHELKNPYGVIKTDGINIISMEEKPKYSSYVNAGIYALQPNIFKYLKKGASCDMPTLFEKLKYKSKRTIVYPMHEVWFDVGSKSDIKIANNFIEGKND